MRKIREVIKTPSIKSKWIRSMDPFQIIMKSHPAALLDLEGSWFHIGKRPPLAFSQTTLAWGSSCITLGIRLGHNFKDMRQIQRWISRRILVGSGGSSELLWDYQFS